MKVRACNVGAQSEPPKKQDENDPGKAFHVGGYIETFFAWSFAQPGNAILEGRGGDSRHDTFTLQNAVLDAGFHAHDLLGLLGRIALQTGTWPASYYGSEPTMPGTETTGGSDPGLWRYLQRATLDSSYGGVERPGGAPEGRAWRHATEGFVQLDATDWLDLAAHAAAGFEHTRFGAARYAGGALLARAKLGKYFDVAARGDALPDTDLYFRREAIAPNTTRQDTLLRGVVGWF